MEQVSISTATSKPETGFPKAAWLVNKFITDAAKAWNLSPKWIIVICAIPFVIALTGVITALIGKDTYKWFTQEDGFAETMQVVFYTLSFVLSLIIARRQWQAGDKVIALLYSGLGLALFFLIGEELNWGQRILGWGTPESFAAINKQGETNLHNINGVGYAFKWIQLLVGAYGTILPLVVFRWTAPARFREMIPKLVPHYTLIPYFLLLFVWRIYRNLLEAPEKYYFAIAEYNEVMELTLAMGIFLFMVFQLRKASG